MKRGIWISTKDKFPKVLENDDGEHSGIVLFADKNNCLWLGDWDGEMWKSLPEGILFNKYYITDWMKIPRRKHAR